MITPDLSELAVAIVLIGGRVSVLGWGAVDQGISCFLTGGYVSVVVVGSQSP